MKYLDHERVMRRAETYYGAAKGYTQSTSLPSDQVHAICMALTYEMNLILEEIDYKIKESNKL